MDDLIKALQIFSNYLTDENYNSPTFCLHDEFCINVSPNEVSESDKEELEKLGFYTCIEYDSFVSYRFGN